MSRLRPFFVTALLLAGAGNLSPAPAIAAAVSGTVILVDADGRPMRKPDHSGVVVWIEPLESAPRPASSQVKQTVMDQRNKTFLPHVLAIEVGTAVDFPNNDPIFHNAFSNYSSQIFDVQLYAPETSRRVVFRRPGIVHVFCNIHETMSAAIAVLSTPYFAVTGADGRFKIEAPRGGYRLRFWHERTQPDVLQKLEQQLAVGDEGVTLGEMQIPAGSSVVTPHKNKYGHEYAPRPAEHVFYPGARR